MRLERYPRPPQDTGIGFHFSPEVPNLQDAEVRRWLVELHALGASWLVLRSEVNNTVPELLVRELVAGSLEPVILMTLVPLSPVDQQELRVLLQRYASWGVHYVCLGLNPNLASAWPYGEWPQPALVERYVEWLLPSLETTSGAGLVPLFPALYPGGHFWDTAFLAAALEHLKQRGKGYLFDRFGIGIQNVAFNRPVHWGQGGAARWRDSHPYRTPASAEDHRGFYLFQWYDEIIRRTLGFSLPLVAIRSGAPLGNQEDPSFPPVDEETHAERHLEMVRLLREGELPDALFNHAFWVLTARENSPEAAEAWYRSEEPLPAVAQLKALERQPRRSQEPLETAEAKIPHHKPLHHYVLFAQGDQGILEEDWKAAQRYIRGFWPCCGFRVEEAMEAEFVTIVGSPLGVSLQAERMIRAAGCKVERLAGETPRQTKALLNRLAAEGRRFLSF